MIRTSELNYIHRADLQSTQCHYYYYCCYYYFHRNLFYSKYKNVMYQQNWFPNFYNNSKFIHLLFIHRNGLNFSEIKLLRPKRNHIAGFDLITQLFIVHPTSHINACFAIMKAVSRHHAWLDILLKFSSPARKKAWELTTALWYLCVFLYLLNSKFGC